MGLVDNRRKKKKRQKKYFYGHAQITTKIHDKSITYDLSAIKTERRLGMRHIGSSVRMAVMVSFATVSGSRTGRTLVGKRENCITHNSDFLNFIVYTYLDLMPAKSGVLTKNGHITVVFTPLRPSTCTEIH